MSSRLAERTMLGPAHTAVSRERERMTAEIEAFEALLARVRRIDPEGERDASGRRGSTASAGLRLEPSTDQFATVREAYRETVLAVDHWTAAYDERTVAGSLSNEFSDELAQLLVNPQGASFTPVVAERLAGEVRESVRCRTETATALDEEATALETLRTELGTVLEEVRPVADRDGTFAQRRARLDAALTALEEAAQTHQRYLHQRDEQTDELLTGMVYADLDAAYPGLSALATVRDVLDRLRLHFWAGIV